MRSSARRWWEAHPSCPSGRCLTYGVGKQADGDGWMKDGASVALGSEAEGQGWLGHKRGLARPPSLESAVSLWRQRRIVVAPGGSSPAGGPAAGASIARRGASLVRGTRSGSLGATAACGGAVTGAGRGIAPSLTAAWLSRAGLCRIVRVRSPSASLSMTVAFSWSPAGFPLIFSSVMPTLSKALAAMPPSLTSLICAGVPMSTMPSRTEADDFCSITVNVLAGGGGDFGTARRAASDGPRAQQEGKPSPGAVPFPSDGYSSPAGSKTRSNILLSDWCDKSIFMQGSQV